MKPTTSNLNTSLVAATLLQEGHTTTLTVVSASMCPLLRVGARIRVEPADTTTISPYAIVVVWHGKELLTHRLLHRDVHGLLTKGDACPYADPPSLPEAVVGRVIAYEHRGVWYGLTQPRVRFIDTMLGRLSYFEVKCWRFTRSYKHLGILLHKGIRLIGELSVRIAGI